MTLRPFLWSSRDFGEKTLQFSVKTFFFGLHLTCLPEKDRGRGSSPQCRKSGKIGVKLQIITPNAQQRSAPLASELLDELSHIRLVAPGCGVIKNQTFCLNWRHNIFALSSWKKLRLRGYVK